MGTRLMMTMALLAPLVACGPFERTSIPPGEEILGYGTPTDSIQLTCSAPAQVASVDTVIRPGHPAVILRAGGTTLSLDSGAFSAERRIVLVQEPGQAFRATIDGDTARMPPPPMGKPATLRFDTSRCTPEELEQAPAWYVWRLNPAAGRSQKLATRSNDQRIWAVIDSTSRFMIAN
ncbi:MAG TPA: hypothetical protein VK933_08570 [Longimicrobiales bacterium]|nr:hypothetical protein [Longimicrobiales bacterium]